MVFFVSNAYRMIKFRFVPHRNGGRKGTIPLARGKAGAEHQEAEGGLLHGGDSKTQAQHQSHRHLPFQSALHHRDRRVHFVFRETDIQTEERL